MTAPPFSLLVGDVRTKLRELPDESVHCVVTSIPYYGLRSYGTTPQVWGGRDDCAHEWTDGPRIHKGGPHGPHVLIEGGHGTIAAQADVKDYLAGAFCVCGAWRGELGLEPTPQLYVEHVVLVFQEVRRVLRRDGTLWLNIGDSYASGGHGGGGSFMPERIGWQDRSSARGWRAPPLGLKHKDLIGVPWRVALALQADGWWLRSDIIWGKPNPMPESVTDRPTKSHEYVFLLTKSASYFYDADATRVPHVDYRPNKSGAAAMRGQDALRPRGTADGPSRYYHPAGRNARTVWQIATKPFSGAHFAVFPPELPERCILAGTSHHGACAACGAPWRRVTQKEALGRVRADRGGRGDPASREAAGLQEVARRPWREGVIRSTLGWEPNCACNTTETVPCVVLDPFAGSGTTLVVALNLGRHAVGIEINPEYAALADRRIRSESPAATSRRLDTFSTPARSQEAVSDA